ncbi:MAG: glycogen debranching protein GlgX [Spirochaetaceae bacterium]|jgi:glycogen operon protein|nr:glycogen debranching protein GlgX [Spirochaetaceae bacterium]GMO17305.1 MAG: glycogen debranching protein GlgX [Termitinemataceae bacterium]
MAFGNWTIRAGRPLPLGATIDSRGVNFAVFSRNAKSVQLVLFENESHGAKRHSVNLSDKQHRTGDIWHCHIEGLKEGALYIYRADGLYHPEQGFRFNVNLALLDPYAKALSGIFKWDFSRATAYNPDDPSFDLSYNYNDNIDSSPRCVVIDDSFDWQGDRPLNYPLRFSVLYETHVRGLTMHESSKVEHPGTYRGLVEKIPYFKELGVTGIELLPIHEFNENELWRINPRTGKRLKNYWGYSTVSFFAPKQSYASDKSLGAQVREFKEMVRELHKAGLEIILDVVFNHSAEGNERGPTFNFRGLDNQIYYILNENKRYYQNYSGCGNTLNCNNPIMRNFIIECLRYWVVEMHVDGFRFDLGSILGRNQNGDLMENPPMLEMIAEDPVLRNTKIIAEAWDAGGAYQVGSFPGGRWAEWNDRYRDDTRRYWRNDPSAARHLATRLSGSADLYLRDGRKPFHSINFITSHDGFTMRDLVSYNGKHNEENGEENRDGGDSNWSYNYGFEGSTANPVIEQTREQQMKNFFCTLMISQGTPMILGGDEFGRTQNGNNNAYCQDNSISWFDWRFLDEKQGLFRFVKEMISFRKRHLGFMRPEFYTGKGGAYNAPPDISWFDDEGEPINWEKENSPFALRVDGTKADILADRDDRDFYIMFNAGLKEIKFTVPKAYETQIWKRVVDTSLPSPDDILPLYMRPEFPPVASSYRVRPRSVVILVSER